MQKLIKNKPFFSIVIPTLNEEKTIPFLLKDIANQSFKDFETIIVDANSEDKTVAKVKEFKTKIRRLKTFVVEKRNVSFQRNFGGEKSQGQWLLFMDADNRIPPYFLQGIKFNIELLNCDILSTWIDPDTTRNADKAISTLLNLYLELQKNTKKPVVFESFIAIKRDVFLKLGGFNEKIMWGEGNDLLKRAKKKGLVFQIIKSPKYTYSFRRLRKEGTLKMIRNIAELEIKRLTNKNLTKNQVKNLYPMEGGRYFLIDKKDSEIIKDIFSKTWNVNKAKSTQEKIKRILEKLFKKLLH